MPEIRDWKCGHCGLVVDLPDHETEYDLFVAALNHIREHRWAHLVTAFESGSDRELMRLCEDDDPVVCQPVGPVGSDDVTPVLEGITELLRDDLPRARRLWYPINEDGGFNR